jgi:hypothetical protein
MGGRLFVSSSPLSPATQSSFEGVPATSGSPAGVVADVLGAASNPAGLRAPADQVKHLAAAAATAYNLFTLPVTGWTSGADPNCESPATQL